MSNGNANNDEDSARCIQLCYGAVAVEKELATTWDGASRGPIIHGPEHSLPHIHILRTGTQARVCTLRNCF